MVECCCVVIYAESRKLVLNVVMLSVVALNKFYNTVVIRFTVLGQNE